MSCFEKGLQLRLVLICAERYCALRLLDAFDKAIDALTITPDRGCRLADIPSKYRAISFWEHLWLVYMVDGQTVYVDLIIDNRQNYGKIFIR